MRSLATISGSILSEVPVGSNSSEMSDELNKSSDIFLVSISTIGGGKGG